MSLLFPKRPVGNDSTTIYHQRIWDVLKALESRIAPGLRTSVTTRGVFQEAVAAQTASPPPGMQYRGLWNAVDTYQEGEVVRRGQPNAVSGQDGDTEGGLYIALQAVPAGTEPTNPVLSTTDNSAYWQLLSPEAWKGIKLYDEAGYAALTGGTAGSKPSMGLTPTGSAGVSAGQAGVVISDRGIFINSPDTSGGYVKLHIDLAPLGGGDAGPGAEYRLREITYERAGDIFSRWVISTPEGYVGPA